MTSNSEQLHRQQQKQHRFHKRYRVKEEKLLSSTEISAERRSSAYFLPQWIILIVMSLLVIYIDSKSITACIIVNDRQMSLDIPKYFTSISDAMKSSMQNGAPALLRGSHSTQPNSSREITVRQGTEENEHVLTLLHQQQSEVSSKSITVHAMEANKINELKTSNVDKVGDEPTTTLNVDERRDSRQSKHRKEDSSKNFTDHSGASDKKQKESEDVVERVQMHSEPITSQKVLCLSGDAYGRTMNQYLQLATMLHLLGVNGTTVVAFKNPLFTSFYATWFEPRDDIIVSYDDDSHCDAEYDAATLHYLFFADKWKRVAYQFKTLMPKASIRKEAEQAMKAYSSANQLPVTTVHRRDLEGVCVLFAEKRNLITCPNTKSSNEMSIMEYKDACLIDYPMIANATQGTTVVLYTDGQVPVLDDTFPIISKHSFPVQSWMMAISDVHYGNPFSTVDIVVYFWRMALSEMTGNNNSNNNIVHMHPSACYKETPLEVSTK